jgi:peptide/nickel transport system ATP-binding protein
VTGLGHALWAFALWRAAGAVAAAVGLPALARRDNRPAARWVPLGALLGGLLSGPVGAFLVYDLRLRARDRGQPHRGWTVLAALLPYAGYPAYRAWDDGLARGVEGRARPVAAALAGLLFTLTLVGGLLLAFQGRWGPAGLLWLLGGGVPLLLYLLDRTRRPPVRRPTLLFEDVVARRAAAEGEDAPLVEACGLARRFAARGRARGGGRAWLAAVDGVSLAIAPGEGLGLVGESGSGKSTLGRILLGLDRPDRGEVRYRGVPANTLSRQEWRALRREIQVVFQDPGGALNPRLRIGTQVAEPLAVHRLAEGRERGPRVAKLLQRVGLDPALAGRFPHELSGGQRQRVGIARALATRPGLLVCDEPVSALDVSVRAQVVRLLATLKEEMGLALLLIAHDLSIVRQLCERVAVLYLGRLVEVGPVERVFRSPLHPYTRALLEAVPRVGEEPRGEPPLRGEMPSALDPPPGCRFHPRCPLVEERCRREEPGLRTFPEGREAACYLAEKETIPAPEP